MLKTCSIIAVVAVLATVALGTSAISELSHERAFPSDRTHATPEMIARNPNLF